MKKLSTINEDLFDNIFKKDMNQISRKEDLNININDLEAGPFIGEVYWATEPLEINTQYNISINEFNKLTEKELNGWRLPTMDEFMKLIHTGLNSSSGFDATRFSDNENITMHNSTLLCINELYMIQDNRKYNSIEYTITGTLIPHKISTDTKKYKSLRTVALLVRDNKI